MSLLVTVQTVFIPQGPGAFTRSTHELVEGCLRGGEVRYVLLDSQTMAWEIWVCCVSRLKLPKKGIVLLRVRY